MIDDDTVEPVFPVNPSGPAHPGAGQPGIPQGRSSGIPGRIVAVHRRNAPSAPAGRLLDVSVGAEEYTEIVLRVPARPYPHLEGKRAVLFLDD